MVQNEGNVLLWPCGALAGQPLLTLQTRSGSETNQHVEQAKIHVRWLTIQYYINIYIYIYIIMIDHY